MHKGIGQCRLSRTVRYVQEACGETNKQKEKCDKREKVKAYRGDKREKWKWGKEKRDENSRHLVNLPHPLPTNQIIAL